MAIFEIGSAQRQFRSLDADKRYLGTVVHNHSVVIYYLDLIYLAVDIEARAYPAGFVGSTRGSQYQQEKYDQQEVNGWHYSVWFDRRRSTRLTATLCAFSFHTLTNLRATQGVSGLRTSLYPDIEPRTRGMLALDNGHEMYWEESGRADGVPVAFVHGGPGAGTMSEHRRFFNPEYFRIILFDQRGAGRSIPQASIEANTTADLIADMERLRTHLGVESWHLFGGSWGSTLALAYAQAYPDRTLGMVLRGIFTCSRREVDWFISGLGRVFPDAWEDFTAAIPEAERGDLLTAYRTRLNDPDPAVHMTAAQTWATYEARCSSLKPNAEAVRSVGTSQGTLALARIEAHYLANGAFLAPDQLFRGIDRIRHIPTAIVHGRYDMVCPIETAYRLHKAWPDAAFTVVPDAGHSALEPGTRMALLGAVEQLKTG